MRYGGVRYDSYRKKAYDKGANNPDRQIQPQVVTIIALLAHVVDP
jgi:hypothetical protein